MKGIRIWFCYFGGEDILPKQHVIHSFEQIGINVSHVDNNNASCPGFIIFDRVTDEFCRRVSQFSLNGFERIIAVAVTHTDLQTKSKWRILQAGASDVFAWDQVSRPEEIIAARFKRWMRVEELVQSKLVRENLIGESRAWISLLRQVVEIAYFTDASVLITGETGTGKELIARLIHTLDARPNKRDLIVCDCTTIVPELSGSEFFGHERGAFTHAIVARDGAFALADGGILFLDEVGELPLSLQAELLRVVQEGTYKRVGSNTWKKINFRLICATNRNPEEDVANSTFRRDFYYRIASWRCRLPSLESRQDDILLLANHFYKNIRPEMHTPEFDAAVQEFLTFRHYPGNIRELEQLITRIAWRHVGDGPITVGDIPENERSDVPDAVPEWNEDGFSAAIKQALAQGVNMKEIGNVAIETAMQIALEQTGGNLREAAQILGVTQRALQMRQVIQRQKLNGNNIS